MYGFHDELPDPSIVHLVPHVTHVLMEGLIENQQTLTSFICIDLQSNVRYKKVDDFFVSSSASIPSFCSSFAPVAELMIFLNL